MTRTKFMKMGKDSVLKSCLHGYAVALANIFIIYAGGLVFLGRGAGFAGFDAARNNLGRVALI